MPVLLVLNVDHNDGKKKAFLHDSSCCAFPEEKEYLLGLIGWMVTKITEETLEYEAIPFDVTVIYLK